MLRIFLRTQAQKEHNRNASSDRALPPTGKRSDISCIRSPLSKHPSGSHASKPRASDYPLEPYVLVAASIIHRPSHLETSNKYSMHKLASCSANTLVSCPTGAILPTLFPRVQDTFVVRATRLREPLLDSIIQRIILCMGASLMPTWKRTKPATLQGGKYIRIIFFVEHQAKPNNHEQWGQACPQKGRRPKA